jgi:hypothetical protein
MLNIHIMTVGASAFDLYLKISGQYPINGICLLVEVDADKKIQDAIEKIRKDCSLRDILFDLYEYPPNNFQELIGNLQKIRKKYPEEDYQLLINVSSGRRDSAVMTFIAGMWINCIGYYLSTDMKEKIEFPTPKVSLAKIEKNKFYRRIIQVLNEKEGHILSQSQLIDRIRINPNTNQKITFQLMSQSIERLESYGLLEKGPRDGREDRIKLTLAGFIADTMISKTNK